jgi:hypothetical protein
VTRIAPRVDPRLLAALDQLLACPDVPIAETHRRLGAVADALSLPRPSYEKVRVLVHEQRRKGALATPVARVLLDIAMRSRPPSDALKLAAGNL